ncbi:MAG: hypothetical protein NT027_09520 [Proteobacteria bacterium]|nr:hypothetical protein [Pseudomonadota bacterium]
MKNYFVPGQKCHCTPNQVGRCIVKAGSFTRKEGLVRVQRYRCLVCSKRFSDATGTLDYRQQKRMLNIRIFWAFNSNVSMRRISLETGLSKNTIAKRLLYFSKVAHIHHKEFLKHRRPSNFVQFDDMESFEHSKLKPLSMPIAVDANTREILSFDVAGMPAKGPLAAHSIKKYGRRTDERNEAWYSTLESTKSSCITLVTILTDKHRMYPKVIQKCIPKSKHITVKGRKPRSAGQGELKRGRFDPMFSFNHTAAMYRANVSRLIRKTWCTTKKKENLKHHMMIYIMWHNENIRARSLAGKTILKFELNS